MDLDNEALKSRLLEIARREAAKFGEDTIKEMHKNIKLEKNTSEKWFKIIYVGKNVQRQPINKDSFRNLLTQLSPDGNSIEFEIFNEENDIKFQFKNEDIVNKVYDHYNNFFFGNMQQEVVQSFLTNYIHEMLDEGCATGACSCHSDSCDTCDTDIPSDEIDKGPD
jgi:hypothetical protein